MRTPSPSYCRLDLAPPLADRFIFGVAPIDYGPVLLLMPFGFHLAMETLPSGNCEDWLQVCLGCFRLSPSCPFRLLHTCSSSRPARHYPRVWIQRSSSERRRDLNPPDQRAAQRTIWASPTPCQGAPWLCIPMARWSLKLPPDRVSQAPRLIFPRALSPTTPEGPMAACACCFTTGLVWLHPSRADWPPSYSYRGRIGFTCVTARVLASRVRQLHYWNPRSFGYVSNRQFTR
jgi:hypothetical protein